MESKLVSIIVPVYKVEKYLAKCVESLICQTYKNIEIILVDDGSPDESGKLCDEFASKDVRIMVIHKQNGGPSSARNEGLCVAKGEYIAFVDGDDWVDDGFILTLYDLMINQSVDMAACGFCRVKDWESERKIFDDGIHYVTEKKIEYAFDEEYYAGYSCNKMFRADVIKNNGIRFNEEIFNGEDFLFVAEYLMHADKVAFTKQDLYYYFYREQSLVHTAAISPRALSVIAAREKAMNMLKGREPIAYDMCKSSYLSQLCKVRYLSMQDKSYTELCDDVTKKIKENKKGLLSLRGIGLKGKAKLWLMISFPRLMAKIYIRNIS